MILTSKAKQFCSNFVSVLCYLKDRHNLEATAGSIEIPIRIVFEVFLFIYSLVSNFVLGFKIGLGFSVGNTTFKEVDFNW